MILCNMAEYNDMLTNYILYNISCTISSTNVCSVQFPAQHKKLYKTYVLYSKKYSTRFCTNHG